MLKLLLSSLIIILTMQTTSALQLQQMSIFLDQGKGQKEIKLVNDRNAPIILVTSFGDTDSGIGNVFYTPSMVKLGPQQTQTVRFIISPTEKIPTEILRFVSFADVPKSGGAQSLNLILKQQIPLIIHPAGLAIEHTPWKFIKATRNGHSITLHNDSPYVVRLFNKITMLPSQDTHSLKRGYLLANESVEIPHRMSDQEIKMIPKNLSGYLLKESLSIKIQ